MLRKLKILEISLKNRILKNLVQAQKMMFMKGVRTLFWRKMSLTKQHVELPTQPSQHTHMKVQTYLED